MKTFAALLVGILAAIAALGAARAMPQPPPTGVSINLGPTTPVTVLR